MRAHRTRTTRSTCSSRRRASLRASDANTNAPAKPQAPAEQGETGFLTLDTNPWTKVSLDGKALGNAARQGVGAAGTQTLVMENPSENVKRATTTVVKPNETVSKRLAS